MHKQGEFLPRALPGSSRRASHRALSIVEHRRGGASWRRSL